MSIYDKNGKILDKSRPVIQKTLSGEFIAEFASVKAASKQFGGKSSDQSALFSSIRYTIDCKNKFKRENKHPLYKYMWAFKD